MPVLRRWFGPSKKEIWRQLSAEIDGQYVEGGFAKSDKVVATHGEWTVTLDTYVVSTGKTVIVFTRMRAPFVNPSGFRFNVYRKGLFTELGRMLGVQDVEIGDEAFDRDFVIQGTDEAKLQELFASASLRQLLAAQPAVRFSVKDDEGWFGQTFPAGVDELCFQVTGVIKDTARLKRLFELFSETLDQLCRIGSAYRSVSQPDSLRGAMRIENPRRARVLATAAAIVGLARVGTGQMALPDANTWKIDPAHSAANFSVRHLVISTVRGKLGPVTGTVWYDGTNVSAIRAEATIDLKRLNTGDDARDASLRGDDFFGIDRFPTITFKSKRAVPAADGHFSLIGDLTIRDVTKEVTLDVEGPSPILKTQKEQRTVATATLTINRFDYGLKWNRLIETGGAIAGPDVKITIDLEVIR